ncbi:hypothetical protein MKW94_007535 [Papaver nudicaule]|uniref:Late embryogenesis abundant protein LEA-2 subgroup domain-containing protein n=1 Tax=Papaver nudicaule TaxID=74823 RepID=A0AA41SDR8_PAPNU|nr:hypothetical protein [Papaver nudicaule]
MLTAASTPAPANSNRSRLRLFFRLGIAVTLSAALLWFTIQLRPHCSLEKFYIPALNKTSNHPNSTAISLELSFWNRNNEKSIYFDNLSMTLYYYHGKSLISLIGYTSIPEFYQQHRHTKHHAETIQTFGVPWEDVKMKVSNGSTGAVFRVNLVMNVRYWNGIWKSRRHELRLGVNVTINDQGMKSVNSSLRLSNASGPG